MPIGSGGAGGGGSLTLFNTTTLGADGTFDVATIPATGSDLLLVLVGRGARASTNDAVIVRFNNDSTAANYEGQNLNGNLAVASASSYAAGAFSGAVMSAALPASTGVANRAGVVETWIHAYAGTTFQKTTLSLAWGDYNGASGKEVDYTGGVWASTAAITRVQVQCVTTANLLAGSVLRIYVRL